MYLSTVSFRACSRNPSVRNGFRANGFGARDAVLTPHPVYLALGASAAERQRAYRALFERPVDAEAVRLLRQLPLGRRAIASD